MPSRSSAVLLKYQKPPSTPQYYYFLHISRSFLHNLHPGQKKATWRTALFTQQGIETLIVKNELKMFKNINSPWSMDFSFTCCLNFCLFVSHPNQNVRYLKLYIPCYNFASFNLLIYIFFSTFIFLLEKNLSGDSRASKNFLLTIEVFPNYFNSGLS